jgi:undecaprenyl-diphosphatase
MFTRLINAGIYQHLALFSRYISRTGDGHLYALLIGFLYLREGVESVFLQTLLFAFLIERPVYFILKNGFKRKRL